MYRKHVVPGLISSLLRVMMVVTALSVVSHYGPKL